MYFHFVLFPTVAKKVNLKEKTPTKKFCKFPYWEKKKLISFFLVFLSFCLEKLLSPSL